MLFNTIRSAVRSLFAARAPAAAEYPLEIEEKLNRAHGRAPVDWHLRTLFGDTRVGDENFADLYTRCLEHTGTAVTPFNVFQRFETRHALTRYFLETLPVPGARAECGAYRGATGLLLCHAWRSREAGFRGDGFYLIDSFSGTSASVAQDLIPVRGEDGATRMEPFFPVGKTDVTPEMVRGFFGDFPDVRICAGWIPQAFETLPERKWAFVHLDLTLFEPTLAALEYFYPRLSRGGVILCDGSVFCPGAEKAWERYCSEHDLAWATLGHRESVLVGQ